MFALVPRHPQETGGETHPEQDESHGPRIPAAVIYVHGGKSAARGRSWAAIRSRWRFNWAVMATLVPSTSLPPCDWCSRGKERGGRRGFMSSSSALPSTPLPSWGERSAVGLRSLEEDASTRLAPNGTFLSGRNSFQTPKNPPGVPVVVATSFQPRLWLSGAGLAFLARLHQLPLHQLQDARRRGAFRW